MNHNRSLLALLSLFLPIAVSAQVTFTQTAGPGTNQIWSFAKLKNNVVLVATSKKVFRSSDQGATWSPSVQQFDISTKGTLAVDPTGSKAYCMDASGLSTSTDQGATWTRVTSLSATNLFGIAVNSAGTIFAGSFGAGVYVSTDDGSSWNAHSNGLPREPGVNDLYPIVRVVAAPNGSVYAIAQGGGLARSTDQGNSWTVVGDGILPQTIGGCAVAYDGKIYVSGQTGVFVSGDDGANWQNIAGSNGLTVTGGGEIATDDAGSGVLLSSAGALWMTTGGSWSNVRAATSDDHNALLIGGSDAYFLDGMANNSLFRSMDNGQNWAPSAKGIISAAVPAFVADRDGRLFAVADTNGLYVSNDFGDTWNIISDPALVTHNISSICACPNGDLYATIYGLGLMQSTDKGQHWTNQAPNMPGTNKPYMLASCCTPSGDVFAAGFNGTIYRSTNGGSTWAIKRSGVPTDTVTKLVSSSVGVVFAVCASGVYSTVNNGDTWQSGTSSPANVTAITSIGGVTFAANGAGIFASSDSGKNWQQINASIIRGTGLVAAHGGGGYYATTTTDLVYSADGFTWKQQQFPFATAPIGMIQDPKYGVIYVATAGSGLYRSPAPKGVNDAPRSQAAQPTLSVENYPNPFVASTTVRYEIAAASEVELAITDLTGKFVVQLASGKQEAGMHSVIFDAPSMHLPSGVYLCTLRCNGTAVTTPVIYLSK
ncbi:MAG: T9SS type A sorting domain-containing protein [Bacteroidetes bacterium]|nr:T9SS type A sorting domain-containing protein [Bacteroidota bacterium]